MHTSNNGRARARTICEHKTRHILIEKRRVKEKRRMEDVDLRAQTKRGGKKEEREKKGRQECLIDSMFMQYSVQQEQVRRCVQ